MPGQEKETLPRVLHLLTALRKTKIQRKPFTYNIIRKVEINVFVYSVQSKNDACVKFGVSSFIC